MYLVVIASPTEWGQIAVSIQQAVQVRPASQASFEPYGWVLGKPPSVTADPAVYTSPATDFWHEHVFDPGKDGDVEVLWVKYRDNDPIVDRLEKHCLTQQAVIPLTGAITQIVACEARDGTPDLTSVRAFRLSPGIGVCMRPGVWHATRSDSALCLMLTRRSTTLDLVKHLKHSSMPHETALHEISPIRLRYS
jgi:ureidoglycolate lyase